VRKTLYKKHNDKNDRGGNASSSGPGGGNAANKFISQWIPWTPGVPIKGNDLLVTQDLEYLDFNTGDSFPEVPLVTGITIDPSSDRPYLDHAMREDILANIKFRSCYATIRAKVTGAIVVGIPLIEFFKFATQRMIADILKVSCRFRVPYTLMQESYLQSVGMRTGNFEASDPNMKGDFRKILQFLIERHKEMDYDPLREAKTYLKEEKKSEEEEEEVKVEEPPPPLPPAPLPLPRPSTTMEPEKNPAVSLFKLGALS
jgi:hypothetical protein